MLNYFLRRLYLLASTLLTLSIISFSLGHMFPGDPVENFSGQRELGYTEYNAVMHEYALDQNYAAQYIVYLRRVFSGDLGMSFNSEQSIAEEFSRVFPATIELCVYALLLATLLGIPLGFWAGFKHKKLTDYSLYSLSVIGNSIPLFWLGLMFILFFGLNLSWLPMSGRINLLYEIPAKTGFIMVDIWLSTVEYKTEAAIDALKHLVMPTLTLAMVPITLLLAFTRNSVITVMKTDYVKAAQTKGLSQWQLARKHIFRNALLPVIPQFSVIINTLMTSVIITEMIFSWPGIGHWLMEAIYQRDYPVLQSGLLIISSLVILIHIIIDLIYVLVNPIPRN